MKIGNTDASRHDDVIEIIANACLMSFWINLVGTSRYLVSFWEES